MPLIELERLDITFFSDLSSLVQQSLKTKPVPSDQSPHSAFLMAETSQLDENSNAISTNSPIWHDSVVEHGANKIGTITSFGSSQIASSEVNITHISTLEIGSDESSISQIGIIQATMSEASSTQVRSLEISSAQIGLPKMSISQDGITQINSIQNHFSQERATQINTRQISTNQLVRGSNFDSTEISLPSSITLQQLLSSHNSNLQNTVEMRSLLLQPITRQLQTKLPQLFSTSWQTTTAKQHNI